MPEGAPRLSQRLRTTLCGEEPFDLQAAEASRAARSVAVSRDAEGADAREFCFEALFPLAAKMQYEHKKRMQKAFREFLALVAEAADDAAGPSAAATMFKILTADPNASADSVRSDLQELFGSIRAPVVEQLLTLARQLHSESAEQRRSTSSAPASSSSTALSRTRQPGGDGLVFGADIVFNQPAAVDFPIPIFPAAAGAAEVPTQQEGATHGGDRKASPASPVSPTSPTDVPQQLLDICTSHVIATSSPMAPETLATEVAEVCASEGQDGDLQGRLFELLGAEGFDAMLLIMELAGAIRNFVRTNPSTWRQRIQAPAAASAAAATTDDEPFAMQSSNFSVMTQSQRNKSKQSKKKSRKLTQQDVEQASAAGDRNVDWLAAVGFDSDYLSEERSLGLQKGSQPGSGGSGIDLSQFSLQYHEQRSSLPSNATRKTGDGFEEVHIPAPTGMGKADASDLVAISELEDWAQTAFPGTTHLNRIQSAVFQTAYYSNENMLICAPTGAGKTNIAMLTFLNLVRSHVSNGVLDKAGLKAIYIAPMKALAQEVVTKFSERLAPLQLEVREFTGDMQLTRAEIEQSQLIVTTPEKWDVVTRKGGDGTLGTMVKLIIIDEVHLLADERGAVIESIVARTQRYVESSQQMIRLIGLSATLPNYADVATFLHVNPTTGLFFFGPNYRPVPLAQTFIGVTEKDRTRMVAKMNQLAYEKVVESLRKGDQVMVFVHSRKDTFRTAEAFLQLAGKKSQLSLFDGSRHDAYSYFKKQVSKSRNAELNTLFPHGLGIHHAGMLRPDRSLTERMFEQGVLRVLFCTATLAWGVNLPAHTVVIKGTELYDPERGGWTDISMLDVLQIFGRAGRPQYDTSGEAIMLTPHRTLAHYLGLLGQQTPMESTFIKNLADHMNAEIVSGTITNIKEAATWLSYTFLYVRMLKNPMAYGMSFEERLEDAMLENKRKQLVRDAADTLDRCQMIRYDPRSGNLAVTDLGRIASHYYIHHDTIDAFNKMLNAHLSESDALHVLASANEFESLKVRPEELPEIDKLRKWCKVDVKGAVEDTAGKVNVLLQGYINQAKMTGFTIISDTNYIAQNAGRIARALFEISLRRGWSSMTEHYLTLSKCIDRRMWWYHTPLRQFHELPEDIIQKIEERGVDVDRLIDMQPAEIGQLIHQMKYGRKILGLVKKLPWLDIEVSVQPITRGIIRVTLQVTANFEWSERFHGSVEPWWIWVEDGENEYIYHSEYFLLHRKQFEETHTLTFTIPIREPLPPQYYVRAVSDRWVGCEVVVPVSFQHLILPELYPPHTDLLDIHPVPRSALNNPAFEALYKFPYFNPLQSQIFHVLYHTDNNVLVGSPTGSGKTITAELALLRLLNKGVGAKAVYIAPLKALARERLNDWRDKFGRGLGLSVLELTGDVTPDAAALKKADVLVTTPEKWDGITRGWQQRDYVTKVQLLIIDEIHLLGEERGPVLELIVSRMRYIASQTENACRMIGLSTALANPRDLADWLGIGEVGVYNFRPSVRPIPMSIHIQGFPGKHYCPRMATMNKPTYAAIMEHSPTKPALVFVSSRRQTRLTALDLISFCATDDNPKQFLHMPEEEIEAIASTIRDKALRDTLPFGIGIHHAGLDDHDRNTVESLFCNAKIQVLVCTSTLAWGVNFPAHLVVVKGTEYFDAKQSRYVDFPITDVLQMMGRAGRPQFDDSGVACILVHEPKKNFYRKFLHEPFPVESSLHKCLHNHLNAEIANGTVKTVPDTVEYLTWTYYFRRLVMNPSYYQLEDGSPEAIQEHLLNLVMTTLRDLEAAGCISINEQTQALTAEPLGKIASYYYLDYRTVKLFDDRLTAHPHMSIPELVELLASAEEFAELPLRHNEELLNEELAQQLPWPADMSRMSDPRMKAFLLLQAHFAKAPLPITDFINDTKSVLDQALRILNAMVDIAASFGLLHTVLQLTTVSQMIVQGVLHDSNQLEQLPNVTPDIARSITKSGILDLKTLLNTDSAALDRAVSKAFPANSGRQLLSHLRRLPKVSLAAMVAGERVVEGAETSIAVTITNHAEELRDKVHAPRYHKPKDYAWWLVLGDQQGELLALKRIGSLRRRLDATLVFDCPDATSGPQELVLYLVSDCMLGLEATTTVRITVAPEDEGETPES